nr:hypothetical protein [Chitinophagaceae bacterium]
SALFKKEKFTCLTLTVVPNAADNFFEVYLTNKFCTGAVCIASHKHNIIASKTSIDMRNIFRNRFRITYFEW